MKTWQKIVIFLGIITICLGVIWMIAPQEEYFRKVPLNKNSNTVYNTAGKPYLDTIIYLGLSIVEVKGIVLVTKPLLNFYHPDFQDVEAKAYVRNQGSQYILWIGDLGRNESIRTIAHELIHIGQYYRSELEIKPGMVLWKGELIPNGQFSYADSPWEKEAFSKQVQIEEQLRKVLYGKNL